jgi:hypothetical protein
MITIEIDEADLFGPASDKHGPLTPTEADNAASNVSAFAAAVLTFVGAHPKIYNAYMQWALGKAAEISPSAEGETDEDRRLNIEWTMAQEPGYFRVHADAFTGVVVRIHDKHKREGGCTGCQPVPAGEGEKS